MQDLAEKFKAEREAYFAKKIAHFTQLGSHVCKKCGYINCRCEEIELENKLKAEKAAQTRKQNEIARLGGIRAYEDFTEEKYTNKKLLQAMSNYPAENYYLWGKAGSGKTHAAVAVLRKVQGAQVVRMSQISREIRSMQDPAEETEIIKKYASIPMLLDDLGSEKATEFLQSILFEIMDQRWQNKQGGLIITANINIEGLKGIIGDRTVSRIAGIVGANNTLELSGTDYRLKGALL